jgi:hypothetical protein
MIKILCEPNMNSERTFLKRTSIVYIGEEMRKVLVYLLVVGFLIGTFAAIEGMCQECSPQEDMGFSGDEWTGNGIDGPTPCGGGGDGGPPTPG